MPSTAIVQDSHRVVPRSGSTRPQQVPLVSCNSLLGSPLVKSQDSLILPSAPRCRATPAHGPTLLLPCQQHAPLPPL
jgi:hypothetical protein